MVMVDTAAFRQLYPFRSRYLERNGLQYHYIDHGTGHPVVMVHGNPTWSFYFRNLISALSDAYRVIAPDHMGCGLSDRPKDNAYDYRLKSRIEDLEALLDHLNVRQNITLIVHDWGGMIGSAYAVRHRERIARMVVMNTAAFLPPQGKAIPWQLKLIRDVPWVAEPAVLHLNLFARGALYMARRKKMPREVKRGLIAPYNCAANRLATLKFVQDIPLTPNDPSYTQAKFVDDHLDRLSDCPMLILWGKKDFVFDMDYFDQWRNRFPASETHVFPNAGHYVMEDEAEAIPLIVKDFFRRHPIGESSKTHKDRA